MISIHDEGPIRILLIEDEEYDVRRIRNTLAPFADRFELVDIVSDGPSGVALVQENPGHYDVVIMDYQIPGGLVGEALIRKLKEADETLQIIVVTKMTMNVTDFQFANKLLEAGAMWYCTKYPGDIEEYIYQPTDFILSLFNAYEKRKLMQEQMRSRRNLRNTVQRRLEEIRLIGQSPAIQAVREQIERYANTPANVLLYGPSGAGKEVVAQQIHYRSPRKYANFVPINCGSLPPHLIESELFGFEKGAFTGASARKKGLFEIADGGTVFLDEITELPVSAQSKLLRVLQEGEIDKIGRTGKIRVDVRVIAATNRDLRVEVEQGRLREDLFYRLNVVSIRVPPLSERREDIPLLVEHFLTRFSQDMGRTPPRLNPDAMAVLCDYPWPGNVRELQNVVQRLLFSGLPELTSEDVALALGTLRPPAPPADSREGITWSAGEIIPWRELERKVQERYFRFVRQHARSDAEAARLLGLAPPNYYRMCKKLGLK